MEDHDIRFVKEVSRLSHNSYDGTRILLKTVREYYDDIFIAKCALYPLYLNPDIKTITATCNITPKINKTKKPKWTVYEDPDIINKPTWSVYKD